MNEYYSVFGIRKFFMNEQYLVFGIQKFFLNEYIQYSKNFHERILFGIQKFFMNKFIWYSKNFSERILFGIRKFFMNEYNRYSVKFTIQRNSVPFRYQYQYQYRYGCLSSIGISIGMNHNPGMGIGMNFSQVSLLVSVWRYRWNNTQSATLPVQFTGLITRLVSGTPGTRPQLVSTFTLGNSLGVMLMLLKASLLMSMDVTSAIPQRISFDKTVPRRPQRY